LPTTANGCSQSTELWLQPGAAFTAAGEAEARGEPLPVIDGLIATTSLAHATVATRNIGDFERCGALR
jgi:predicted nucleic acid-binding protein